MNKRGGGASTARNIGLKNATGKWIGFVDSDDYIDKTMYEKLIKNSKDVELVSCQIYTFDNHNCNPISIKYESCSKNYLLKNMLNFHDTIVPNKIYLREKIGKLLFNENLKIVEDGVFTYQYLDNINKVKFIDDKLYYYRQHNSSSTHMLKPDKYITSIESYYLINKIMEKYDIFERYYIQCDSICNFYIYKHKLGKDYDCSKYERIIKSYLDDHILRKKIGLQNRIKIIMAVYFTPLYLLLKRVK